MAEPLKIAAKYGNTAICEILIKKMKCNLSLPAKIRFYFYDRKLTSAWVKKKITEIFYNAFKIAVKYNNFATAEYIYTVYEAYSKNNVTR